MQPVLKDLVDLLALERIDRDLFRGNSQDLGWHAIFGGQVFGQALSAATQTVGADRPVHSAHGYFLRAGELDRPIVYQVARLRDGKSFTTRQVVAVQEGDRHLQPGSVVSGRGGRIRAPGRDARGPAARDSGLRARARARARRQAAGDRARSRDRGEPHRDPPRRVAQPVCAGRPPAVAPRLVPRRGSTPRRPVPAPLPPGVRVRLLVPRNGARPPRGELVHARNAGRQPRPRDVVLTVPSASTSGCSTTSRARTPRERAVSCGVASSIAAGASSQARRKRG